MIVFFPGKFQPPHLGHILTIIDLSDNYDKVIVGITEDCPAVLKQNERIGIFNKVFKNFDNVDVVPITGILTEYTKEQKELLPVFDVCVSGNNKVLKNMSKLGYKCTYKERSKGIGYSGTAIRSLINE